MKLRRWKCHLSFKQELKLPIELRAPRVKRGPIDPTDDEVTHSMHRCTWYFEVSVPSESSTLPPRRSRAKRVTGAAGPSVSRGESTAVTRNQPLPS